MEDQHEHPFYGQDIYRQKEQLYIKKLLKKYRHEKVSDELKKKVWEELQMEKYKGNITIPFKVVTHLDPTGLFPEYIDVILDTKV
ncbi:MULTISPECIES: hypothetical protein [Parachlamydia]|jgi:hypothetical protein|uniref:Uncharacterized protein n=2 Tax=Parachlamydia acanthamoebae TaxID=83552 RepID=F8KYP1_PARAV|nr:hypothetical protein [Parachlamydia acanthamoebae]EFB41140.1 hypothetical protein pah_c050o114 [Parachlamydia acanthamoebae str. Hall's coccus]KIA78295.1 hypothetical protein DB43_EI00400 [Parachlamydia acanthamoebae]CCB85996.1 putative uncharacterized protein [Parachlamydia acanthamoebae UV-7]